MWLFLLYVFMYCLKKLKINLLIDFPCWDNICFTSCMQVLTFFGCVWETDKKRKEDEEELASRTFTSKWTLHQQAFSGKNWNAQAIFSANSD